MVKLILTLKLVSIPNEKCNKFIEMSNPKDHYFQTWLHFWMPNRDWNKILMRYLKLVIHKIRSRYLFNFLIQVNFLALRVGVEFVAKIRARWKVWCDIQDQQPPSTKMCRWFLQFLKRLNIGPILSPKFGFIDPKSRPNRKSKVIFRISDSRNFYFGNLFRFSCQLNFAHFGS